MACRSGEGTREAGVTTLLSGRGWHSGGGGAMARHGHLWSPFQFYRSISAMPNSPGQAPRPQRLSVLEASVWLPFYGVEGQLWGVFLRAVPEL